MFGLAETAGGGLRWKIKEFTPQMRKSQTADDATTAMEVYLTVLSFADRNMGGVDIRERDIWRMTNDIRKSA